MYYARVMEYKKGTGQKELESKEFTTLLARDRWVTEFNVDRVAHLSSESDEPVPDKYVLAQSHYPTQSQKTELG